jgi:aconitase A
MPTDSIDVRARLDTSAGDLHYHNLVALEEQGLGRLELMPATVKILLENLVRLAETGPAS